MTWAKIPYSLSPWVLGWEVPDRNEPADFTLLNQPDGRVYFATANGFDAGESTTRTQTISDGNKSPDEHKVVDAYSSPDAESTAAWLEQPHP